MVLEKLTATQEPYLRWNRDSHGFSFEQEGNLEELREVVIVPFSIASLALYLHLDGNNVAVVSENPYFGDGKSLWDPVWDDALPANVKAVALRSVETKSGKHIPSGWYNWAGVNTPTGREEGHALLTPVLKVIYGVRDHSGHSEFTLVPNLFIYESRTLGSYGVLRREGSPFDATLVAEASKELLEWHADRVPPYQSVQHSSKWREFSVANLNVQCALVGGRFDVALREAAMFFGFSRGQLKAAAEEIV